MIQQLHLHDFKSFRRARLGFGRLTAIVGANASGKSNCRDALRFLHGVGLGYSLAEVLGGKFGPGGIVQWTGIRGGAKEVAFYGESRFRLGLDLDTGGGTDLHGDHLHYMLEVDVSDELSGPRVVTESLYRQGEIVFDSAPLDDPVSQEDQHEIRVRLPRGGKGRTQGKLLTFPSHTPVLSQLPDRKQEKAECRHAATAVLGALQEMRFLDLAPDAMRQSSPPGQTVLGDRGENLSSVLQAICDDRARKQALLAWVRSLTPMDAVDFDFKLDLQGRVLVYLQEADGSLTSAFSASDGTLRFLALTAALLSQDSGRLYFFEEFDNGIHPTRLHLLLDLIERACAEEGVQVVGTTHNPALLTFLGADSLESVALAYRADGAADSRVRSVASLPDVARILQSQDLGHLLAAGWLEDAAAFSDVEEEPAA